ncbi:hypothetical protein A4G20_02510 [Pasteurellaceae bacterium RH1A]|nr:hypothetical protein A4G20_02510 [Pasteurellaceae bacterium RH1A]
MKKSLLTLLIASSLALSACDDKAVQAQNTQLSQEISQKDQTITKLNSELTALKSEVEKLKAELKANQLAAADNLSAIFVKEQILFEKSVVGLLEDKEQLAELEKEITDKNSDDWKWQTQTPIEYQVSSLTTGIDWLDKLLIDQVFDYFSVAGSEGNPEVKIQNKQQLTSLLDKWVANAVEEAKAFRSIGQTFDLDLNFLHQKENMATFTLFSHTYAGGAHGVYSTNYIVVDLKNKKKISLDDLFTKDNQAKLKERLWESYEARSRDDNGQMHNTWVEKAEFRVPDNFYFSDTGIHFVYSVYELGSFAEGEIELDFMWQELNPLLNKAYQKELKESKFR